MKNKKLIAVSVAFALIVAALLCVYALSRPETAGGAKTITVTVVHKDGTQKEFTCETAEEYLGPVLVSEGIVEGEQGDFGLYFNTADGETADYSVDGGWWKILIGEEEASTGADSIPVYDGSVYKLVYTIG